MSAIDVEVHERLGAAQLAEVLSLLREAADVDGVQPLSEHVLLHLRHGSDDPARNLLARVDGELAGYAHLDPTDEVEGASAELVVRPLRRQQSVGTALVRRLEDIASNGRLRLWAHGSLPAAAVLADRLGYRRARALWQMRRSLLAALPTPTVPDGVAVRTFVPGQDDDAWVALNAAAFADHPDQGKWTVEDLRLRLAESWFDPAGFFLAERDDLLVGFHWTKVHGATEHQHSHPPGEHAHDHPHDHAHDPIGEVYVVGVHPSQQGTGLGKALTLVGLAHLRALGLAQAMLYVDESNVAAIGLYESLGFARWDTDVSYRRG